MARTLTIRQPQTTEIQPLHTVLEEALTPSQRRRAKAILLYAAGLPAVDIAPLLAVHPNPIYADLHAFGTSGIATIHHLDRGGPGRRSRQLKQPRYSDWLRYRPIPWACLMGGGLWRSCAPI